MENPWQKVKEINAIHRRLMAMHPRKAERTAEENEQWNTAIGEYETALGKRFARGLDNEVIVPFQEV